MRVVIKIVIKYYKSIISLYENLETEALNRQIMDTLWLFECIATTICL